MDVFLLSAWRGAHPSVGWERYAYRDSESRPKRTGSSFLLCERKPSTAANLLLLRLSYVQSCSLRIFLRLRFRANASFTRFFSPGFR